MADVTTDSRPIKAAWNVAMSCVGYDGHTVKENADLPLLVANTKAGTKVPIDVVRDGRPGR